MENSKQATAVAIVDRVDEAQDALDKAIADLSFGDNGPLAEMAVSHILGAQALLSSLIGNTGKTRALFAAIGNLTEVSLSSTDAATEAGCWDEVNAEQDRRQAA